LIVAVVGVMPVGATSAPMNALTNDEFATRELAHHRDEQR